MRYTQTSTERIARHASITWLCLNFPLCQRYRFFLSVVKMYICFNSQRIWDRKKFPIVFVDWYLPNSINVFVQSSLSQHWKMLSSLSHNICYCAVCFDMWSIKHSLNSEKLLIFIYHLEMQNDLITGTPGGASDFFNVAFNGETWTQCSTLNGVCHIYQIYFMSSLDCFIQLFAYTFVNERYKNIFVNLMWKLK